MVPGDGPVIEIIYPHVEQYIEDKGKIEKREVKTIYLFTHTILDAHFNAKKPKWFDQKVKKDQQNQVCDESFFQTQSVKYIF